LLNEPIFNCAFGAVKLQVHGIRFKVQGFRK
jgi:hypothetical protein